MKKFLGPIVVLLLIFWIVTAPGNAAGALENLAATLGGWAQNVTSFFSQIAT